MIEQIVTPIDIFRFWIISSSDLSYPVTLNREHYRIQCGYLLTFFRESLDCLPLIRELCTQTNSSYPFFCNIYPFSYWKGLIGTEINKCKIRHDVITTPKEQTMHKKQAIQEERKRRTKVIIFW